MAPNIMSVNMIVPYYTLAENEVRLELSGNYDDALSRIFSVGTPCFSLTVGPTIQVRAPWQCRAKDKAKSDVILRQVSTSD